MNAAVHPSPHPQLADVDGALPDTGYMKTGIGRLQAGLDLHDPPDSAAMLKLLRRLYAAGRYDLALGRLFEGHVDALQIIARYSDAEQARRAHSQARHGACFGVWNAPLAGEPLRLLSGRLRGGKSFASGAGVLSHALITENPGDAARSQLMLVDLHADPPHIDTDWWHTLGMQRSETHRVRWRGERRFTGALIGGPGAYEREPWLSAGALRFVAVQAGGVAAIFDQVRDHLVARERHNDPHQAARLGTLYSLAQQCAALCRSGAEEVYEGGTPQRIAAVAHARCAVADAAERAITLAQQCVGVQALFETHPLCRTLADLMVYLRQPAPDAQRERVGRAAANGILRPAL